MKDILIKEAVAEFAKSNEAKYEKAFSVRGEAGDIFTVKIERKREVLISESVSMEARSNTISALPSGAPCGCCNGSGKSS